MFKNHNRRDAADTETGAEFPFRLGIHFDETDFTAALFCDILEDWRKVTARAAPGGPEVDYHWKIVLQQFVQRFAGRINDFSVKQLMTAASTFCRVLKPIVGDAVMA